MSVVDCGWYNNRISGIIVSVLALSVVDCGWYNNRISGIIVSVLPLSVVDCGFEPCSDETKEYTIAICCFSAKHAPLRNKSQDWLVRNQNNMFE